MKSPTLALTTSLLVLHAVACGGAIEPQTDDLTGEDQAASDPDQNEQQSAAAPVATTCETTFVSPELGQLLVCGGGKGHCYEGAKVPPVGTLSRDVCLVNDVCVPDAILAAAGSSLRACSSIIGPGACGSRLIGEIAANFEQLGQGEGDTCAPDEACVPCLDPQHGNRPTPFCVPLGVHAEACR